MLFSDFFIFLIEKIAQKIPGCDSEGFFLPFLGAYELIFLPAGVGSASDRSSQEGVLLSKIHFECRNHHHLIKLVGIELIRIDVGGVFREIGNFR